MQLYFPLLFCFCHWQQLFFPLLFCFCHWLFPFFSISAFVSIFPILFLALSTPLPNLFLPPIFSPPILFLPLSLPRLFFFYHYLFLVYSVSEAVSSYSVSATKWLFVTPASFLYTFVSFLSSSTLFILCWHFCHSFCLLFFHTFQKCSYCTKFTNLPVRGWLIVNFSEVGAFFHRSYWRASWVFHLHSTSIFLSLFVFLSIFFIFFFFCFFYFAFSLSASPFYLNAYVSILFPICSAAICFSKFFVSFLYFYLYLKFKEGQMYSIVTLYGSFQWSSPTGWEQGLRLIY